jgi:orotate phosphoribosyltransferase
MKPFFPTETERRGARARLRELIREHSLRFGSFVLASGGKSHFYLDLRKTVTHPEGAYLVGTLLLDRLQKDRPDAAGGPSLGADPLAGALAALSHLHGEPLPTFIVRSTAKSHGMAREIEGHLHEGDRVVLLDDVITRGRSLVRAARLVRDHGARVIKVLTLLDRQSGGPEALAREDLSHESLFVLADIMTREELVPPPTASASPAAGPAAVGSGTKSASRKPSS